MERMILFITNRKSVIAFQDFGVHFTYDATWQRKRRFVTSGLEQNREKSLITEKRYEMERKLLLISNRKWVIAFQNPGLYLACDATWRTKVRFVTSGLPQNHEKLLITQKQYNMEQKLVLITNIKSVIFFKEPELYFARGATWRKKL